MALVPSTCAMVGKADGRPVGLPNEVLVSAVDSMGADLNCDTRVVELAPVVFVLPDGGTMASTVVCIGSMVDCRLERCRPVA